MSDSEHSTVTYTSVSIPVEDDSDIGSPGINGPPIMPEDPYAYIMAAYQVPPSPDYIPGPEVPPSPDYIPGPEEPQSPPPLDFVPEPMYPEYMPQEDEILSAEEQPLPATAASPTADSPGYVPESDPEEEPEEDDEDPEEDPADYPADGDEDEDEEEEEEHPVPANSVPPVHRMTARISIRDEPSISLPPREEVKRIENEAKTVPGTVAVRGGRHVSTRYCSDDGWTNQRVTRGTGVCQSEICVSFQRTQDRGIEILWQNEELNRVHEETMQMLRELIKVQDEKRIAIEKEAAELEAKLKSQECLNIEEKSIPQASILLKTLSLSESADLSDGESECDVPINDDSPESHFSTFDNPLFDSNDDFSSDDESLSEEEIQKDEFKYFSNPLYDLDDEIITNEKILPNQKDLDVVIPIPPGIDERCFNAESDLLVVDTDSEPEEEIRLAENLSYDNSSPRPLEERNSKIADMIVESLSPPPIPVEDSDSLMEEIDLFLASDDSMPPGIEIDDYDSEGDIRFLEELLNSDSLPLPENKSFSLDHFNDPSLPRPPPEPPDVEICFNFEPDAGVVTKKVVGDISEHDVLMPNLLPTQPTLCPVFDLLLPFSSENEDKVFNPGIFSSLFSSPRAKITFDFFERPMMISGGDIHHLDVPYLHFYPP
ncbi:hypothetical protein Tco_0496478 [Tanacetum coccineum]